jgi:hypothetical protein
MAVTGHDTVKITLQFFLVGFSNILYWYWIMKDALFRYPHK